MTHLAAFQSNESAVVAVDEGGLSPPGTLPGEAAINARFEGHFATCLVTIPLADPAPRRRLRRPVASELHRRPRLGEAADARPDAVAARRRPDVPPPRLARPDRPPADPGGDAGLPRRPLAREAVRAGRRPARPPRVRRPLGEQVDGPAPAEPVPGRHQGGLEPRRLDSSRLPREHALRRVRPADRHRRGQHLPRDAGHHLPRPPRAGGADDDGQPALPGHPARMRPLPPPPLRGLGAGRLLRVRRLLRQGRAQGDRALAADQRERGDRLRRRQGDGHAPPDRRGHGAGPPLRRGAAGRRRPPRVAGRLDDRPVEPVLRQGDRQPGLGRPDGRRPRRAGRRPPRHQPADQPRSARRPGRRVRRRRLRPEAPDPHDRDLAGLRPRLVARRAERGRRAELLAALPQAAPGRGAARRRLRRDRRPRGLRRRPSGVAGDGDLDASGAVALPRHLRPPRPEPGPALRADDRHLGRRRRCT